MTTNVTGCELATHNWVPSEAIHYIDHTVNGKSIRAIARDKNCHPSTILRQVRRYESRRDDPLVDAALRSLSEPNSRMNKDKWMTQAINEIAPNTMMDTLTQTRIDREALQVLRRLCESGAVLAVARDMETAVIVREDGNGGSVRTAVVEREIAQAIALKEWVICDTPEARIARYYITNAGKEALRRLTAEEENRALGLRNDGRGKRDEEAAWDLRQDLGGGSRYLIVESPLIGLARRKDKDGTPFLSRDQVDVGERLRQDFELAQITIEDPTEWQTALNEATDDMPKAAKDARKRFAAAMEDLGPGLNDVAIRCCCILDGLEATEKNMGWSSRSCKIVLRIALTRLIRHYEETTGQFGPMIG